MDKPIFWVASSLKDLRELPEEVKDEIGYALDRVQKGETPKSATKMHGDLSEVMEIHVDEGGDTYRAVYTVKLEGVIYVLDAFKKKAKRGSKTSGSDLDRIRDRLKAAKLHYQTMQDEEVGSD